MRESKFYFIIILIRISTRKKATKWKTGIILGFFPGTECNDEMTIFQKLQVLRFRLPYFSCPSKSQRLAEAEGRIFSALGIRYLARLIQVRVSFILFKCTSFKIRILQIPFKNTEISTVTVNCEQPSPKTAYPIVLVHGFGAGVALWGSAIKRLAQFQTVHAFDLPGNHYFLEKV